ncbi:MAG: DUF4270 family protein [Ginsengibacter sp.]
MYNNQFKVVVSGILMFFIFGIGCTKIDTTNLGQSLIPAVDNIHTFETSLDVIANNFDDDQCIPIQRNGLHGLGVISDDPYFGKTDARIYVEFKPGSFPYTFPAHDKDSLFVDSAVVVLKYAYSFGDTNTIQKAMVYPLTDRFRVDSSYSSCNVFNYTNVSLGEATYSPKRLKDSVHAFKEDGANQLRITINKSLIESWINNEAAMFKSDTTFKDNFKGFAILPDVNSSGQSIDYFDLSASRLSIYLRSSNANKKDTLAINFAMTQYSGESNSIVRTRGNSEITQHVAQPAAGDSLVYVQTSPGNYVKLTIPGLSTLSNRVIHRAELVVTQLYSPTTFDNIFNVPDLLYLDTKDTSATTYFPIPCDFTPNELKTNFATLGGQPKLVDDGMGRQVNRYVFNISRYVQSIVTRKKGNPTLRLRAPYFISSLTGYVDRCNQFIPPFTNALNNIGDGRVKLNGSNNTPTRMKLHIIYSDL